mmetsp:Transcript_71325/g.201031  ORF Transcript_71325/g.201031 Transcript_71325/m.201031 type:complete len:238 (+) Transcript_71325:591-1304(+)
MTAYLNGSHLREHQTLSQNTLSWRCELYRCALRRGVGGTSCTFVSCAYTRVPARSPPSYAVGEHRGTHLDCQHMKPQLERLRRNGEWRIRRAGWLVPGNGGSRSSTRPEEHSSSTRFKTEAIRWEFRASPPLKKRGVNCRARALRMTRPNDTRPQKPAAKTKMISGGSFVNSEAGGLARSRRGAQRGGGAVGNSQLHHTPRRVCCPSTNVGSGQVQLNAEWAAGYGTRALSTMPMRT